MGECSGGARRQENLDPNLPLPQGVDSSTRRDPKKFKRLATGEFVPNLSPQDNGEDFSLSRSQDMETEACEGMDNANNTSRFPKPIVAAEEIRQMWKPWSRGLILKVLGKTVGFWTLEQKLKELWQLSQDFEITDLERGFYVVRFRAKEDYHKTLDGGPWMVQGHYITVTKWRPDFRAEKADITSTMVWVRQPGLPVEYYIEKFLMAVGNCVGKAIKVDQRTLTAERGKFARIYVEVDLKKPLTPFIWVNQDLQRIEYEGLHQICFNCGQYGHIAEHCKSKNQGLEPGEEAVTRGPEYASKEKENEGTENQPFGPWFKKTAV
ncbi:uncharacterized protein LOC113782432 [Coffea eugenioides]|uniref:uncharacterized protein LOC113782432 n=1 Tax=Coffea eugenioides TaxID=49369 RepID=UPI000F609A11|nr:uncharacterized protein LOC113782432 [Coffea eugenioides]